MSNEKSEPVLARHTNRELETLRQLWQDQHELELGKKDKPELRASDVLRLLAEIKSTRAAAAANDLLPCEAQRMSEDEAHLHLLGACLSEKVDNACAALCALRHYGWRIEYKLDDEGFAVLRVRAKKTDGGT